MMEYEKLTENNGYSNNLQKANNDLSKKCKLVALANNYYLLRYDKENAIKNLEYWGVFLKDNKTDDFKKLESTIKRLKTNIKIEAIRNKEKGEDDEDDEGINFDKMFISVNSNLNGVLKKDLSLKEWCAALSIIEDRNKKIKKNKSNGRND